MNNSSLPLVNLIGLDSSGVFGGTAANLSATTGFLADRVTNNTKAPVGIFSEQQLFMLIALCRAIYETNTLAAGFIDSLVNFIGEPRVKFISRDKDRETKESKIAQKCWDKFCADNSYGTFIAPSIDDERSTSREKEARRRWIRDGEVWLRLKIDDKIKARFVEPEQIRTPDFSIEGGDVSWGVVTDVEDSESILGYAILNPYHKTFEFVEKDYIISCLSTSDRTIKRGLPDLASSVSILEKVIGIIRNMSHTAKAQSAIAWLEKWAYAGESQIRSIVDTNSSQQTKDSSRLPIHEHPAGSVISTTTQREFEAGPVAEGADSFATVVAHCLKSIGWKWNYPDWFTGDAQSFASALVTGAPFVRYIESRQDDYKCFTLKLARSVIFLAEKHGLIQEGIYRSVKPEVTMPMVVMADEAKQISTWRTELELGVMDKKEWMIRRGREPRKVMKNIVKFAKLDKYIQDIKETENKPQADEPLQDQVSGTTAQETEPNPIIQEPEPSPPGSKLARESSDYVFVRNKQTGAKYSVSQKTYANNPDKYEIIPKEGSDKKKDDVAKKEPPKDDRQEEPKDDSAEKRLERLKELAANGDKAAQLKLAAISLFIRSAAGARAGSVVRQSVEKIGAKINLVSPQELMEKRGVLAKNIKEKPVTKPISAQNERNIQAITEQENRRLVKQQIADLNEKMTTRLAAQQHFIDAVNVVDEFINQRNILDNRDGIVSSTIDELEKMGVDRESARVAVMRTARINMLKRAGLVVSSLSDKKLANLAIAGFGEQTPFSRDKAIAEANEQKDDKEFDKFLDEHFSNPENVLSYLKNNIVASDGTKTTGLYRMISNYDKLPKKQQTILAKNLKQLAKYHALATRGGSKIRAISEVGAEILSERIVNVSTFPSSNFPGYDSLAIVRKKDSVVIELHSAKRRVGKNSGHDALDDEKVRIGEHIHKRAVDITRELASLDDKTLERIVIEGEREMRDRGFYGSRLETVSQSLEAANRGESLDSQRMRKEVDTIDKELRCTLAKELLKIPSKERKALQDANITHSVVVDELIEPTTRADQLNTGFNIVFNANKTFCEYVATRENGSYALIEEKKGKSVLTVKSGGETKTYNISRLGKNKDKIKSILAKTPTILKIATIGEIKKGNIPYLNSRARRLREKYQSLME